MDTVADAPVRWEDAQAELLPLNLKEIFFIYAMIFTTCGSTQWENSTFTSCIPF